MQASMMAVFLASALVVCFGCSRRHGGGGDPDAAVPGAGIGGAGLDGGLDGAAGGRADAAPDAASDACVAELEICNGVDDDCDRLVDEALSQPCGSNVGACQMGTETCSMGLWRDCSAVRSGVELCNDTDDDCDGLVDESLSQSCGSNVGTCQAGTEMCSAGSWRDCTAVGPVSEACDGMGDEDCDGTVDEGCQCVTGTQRACGSSVGRCRAGIQPCELGAWASCIGAMDPGFERCNHIDDDCDGMVDEALSQACGTDVGVCQAGTETCSGGSWQGCTAVGPGTERCNNIDDDCDGLVDEAGACPACPQGLSAGRLHTCARLGTGEVKCWGEGDSGQLGHGAWTSSAVPVSVKGLTNAVEVRAGGDHTCARLSTGEVKCWGYNREQQLGDETREHRNLPVTVRGLTGALELALSLSHSCARLSTGEVKCWGDNRSAQLGDGTWTGSAAPVTVVGLTNAVEIALPYGGAACARLGTGEVKCWGGNEQGQLGIGLPGSATPVTVIGLGPADGIAMGSRHTCVRLSQGEVKCWGANYLGQLGDGTWTGSTVPVTVTGLKEAVEIDAFYEHTCARLVTGEVRCWGKNDGGRLGDGTTLNQPAPVRVAGLKNAVEITTGGGHTCARLGTGEVRCWGFNRAGQLGDGTTSDRMTPVSIKALKLPACRP